MLAVPLALLAAAMLFSAEPAMASSAELKFSTDAQEYCVGDGVSAELLLTADVAPGEFEGYISYDSSVLEFVSGSECIAGGEGILKVTDMSGDSLYNTKKYVLEFKAVGMGYSEISMRGKPEIYELDSGYLMSFSTSPATVHVAARKEASSDTTLITLKISPGTLTPEFSSSVREYQTTVPAGTEEIFISAFASDQEADVEIEGNTPLSDGQNRILIKVTAEDGSEGKYVIYAVREASGTEPAGESSPEGGTQGSGEGEPESRVQFYAENTENGLTVFSSTQFTVCTDTQDVKIPDGYFRTSIIISGNKVTAYSPSEKLDSEFLLLVLQPEGGRPGLYRYDRTEKTVQRYLADEKSGAAVAAYSTLEQQELTEKYEKTLGTLTLVIAVLAGVCMLLLILTIRMALKKR